MATTQEVRVPDIGDFKDVEIIEILVKPGDSIKKEDSLIALESDKATMEVPSPAAGVVKDLKVKLGDRVSAGSLILLLDAAGAQATATAAASAAPSAPSAAKVPAAPPPPTSSRLASPPPPPPTFEPAARAFTTALEEAVLSKPHASPSVRHFARELGVELARVKGSGPKGRILREDVQSFVKRELTAPKAAPAGAAVGFNLAPMPAVDFSKWGPVEIRALSRIKKLSGANLHRNWVSIPHVTQQDEADITELEAFRKSLLDDAEKRGVKLTLLAFVIKACVSALRQFPEFNASLEPNGENLVLKQYYHLGFAADTPDGLVVPVLRDADKKGVYDIARELAELSKKAREKKISPTEMQGGTFSISSLGGIGGNFFTPIINAPEVAILGAGRSAIRPVHRDGNWLPRLILPLSLSYDHRVIDGAQGARFITYLSALLGDIRRLVI